MFLHARPLYRIFGLDIRIDASWLLIGGLIVWSLYQHVFPTALPDQTHLTYAAMSLAVTLLFAVSLILHEVAHAVTARSFNRNTHAVSLYLFGGVADVVEEPHHAGDEVAIALAGPAVSFFTAGVFWMLASIATLAVPETVTEVLHALAIINFALAAFNLLPGYPLDGGRVLRAWLWRRSGDVIAATQTAARVGMVCAYGVIGLGALSLFEDALIEGMWLILLGLLVLWAAEKSVEAQRVAYLLGNRTVSDLMTRSPIVTTPKVTLAELVNRVMLLHRVSFVPVMEDETLLGHIDSSVIAGMDRENWANAWVGDVFVTLQNSAVIAHDLPITDLFVRIAETGQRKFMVLNDSRLVGVITLADLASYLSLVKDVGGVARHAPPFAAE